MKKQRTRTKTVRIKNFTLAVDTAYDDNRLRLSFRDDTVDKNTKTAIIDCDVYDLVEIVAVIRNHIDDQRERLQAIEDAMKRPAI